MHFFPPFKQDIPVMYFKGWTTEFLFLNICVSKIKERVWVLCNGDVWSPASLLNMFSCNPVGRCVCLVISQLQEQSEAGIASPSHTESGLPPAGSLLILGAALLVTLEMKIQNRNWAQLTYAVLKGLHMTIFFFHMTILEEGKMKRKSDPHGMEFDPQYTVICYLVDNQSCACRELGFCYCSSGIWGNSSYFRTSFRKRWIS